MVNEPIYIPTPSSSHLPLQAYDVAEFTRRRKPTLTTAVHIIALMLMAVIGGEIVLIIKGVIS